MVRSTLLLASLLRLAAASQSWTCAGPTPGQHGTSEGSLATGAYQVLQDGVDFLDADETLSATGGQIITLELSGLFSTETFVGFAFVASDGSMAPASSNAMTFSGCNGVRNANENAQNAATADWTLPNADGTYSVTIYALVDDDTWYSSTYTYSVGGALDDDSAARPLATAALSAAAVVALARA
mmetsp:Transcript_6150/g.18178  ORF Transcript_6150/g.18178 Transcript_6150/m.18178 type:complete len:184 (+) Transcript_6150:205-756(+)